MFQLTKGEFDNLKFQFGTSSWGGARSLPHAFTEQGVAMLAGILNSDRAINVNIQIMRIFTRVRQLLTDNLSVKLEIEEIKKKLENQDKNIELVFSYLDELIEKQEILPGMPFEVYKGNLNEIKQKFKQEISENIHTQKQGIIAKADSLGSLEALLVLLKQNNIPVVKAGIGKINKSDLISAKANLDINELDAIIVGFNVKEDEEVKQAKENIKIIKDNVIYKLIDDLIEFRQEKQKEIEKERLMKLTTLCKLEILHQYVFRNTKPAIFGVKVDIGKIISNLSLIDERNEKIGRIKNIQAERKSVEQAKEGIEVAISIPGVNFERQLKNIKYLYSDVSESQFKNFKKNKDLLSQKEIHLLQEIAEIKRQKNPKWGM